jgi:hypothetical protein
MEEEVKGRTHYERHKEERKAYQRGYREKHLEEVRKKDRLRKREKKGVVSVIKIDKNVVVSFE